MTTHSGINLLPANVAEDMKSCSWYASWYCSNTRKGYDHDAETDKIAFNRNADSFKQKATGILSPETCDAIKSMFWYEGWYTANTRFGPEEDAKKDKETVEKRYKSIIASKEMSEELASNVKEMGLYAAWYCANTRKGYTKDAEGDKAIFESCSRKITGEVALVEMNFLMNTAKIVDKKPVIVGEQELVNDGDVEQSMSFEFDVTEGKTTSVSTEIGFTYGIKTTFEVGFSGFGSNEFEVSFEFSHNHTFSESITTSLTKHYSYPLVVPKHSTYVAKATVDEADMEVPYELVFDFGGALKSLHGTWKGVAVSKSTYQITKKR